MKLKYDQAKVLRKNLTPPELKLWHGLKIREPGGPVFRRQCAFGPYILDFYCVRAKLAIEVDGADHMEDENRCKDEARDAFMERSNVMTYRIPASAVFRNFEETVDGIWALATERMETLRKG